MQAIKKFLKNKDYKVLSLDDIEDNEDLLNVSSISVKGYNIIQKGDKKVKILYNDYDNPITIICTNTLDLELLINPEWYVDNRDKANDIIRYVCSNTREFELSINNSFLIDDKLIDSLCQNQRLKIVNLDEKSRDKDKYLLSMKHYEMFRKSNISQVSTSGVCDELKENFDPLIEYNVAERHLIGSYVYSVLHDSAEDEIYINFCLDDDEINNFKHLSSSKIIIFNIDNYFDLIKIINKLKELNYSNRVEVKVKDKDKEKFNSFILNNSVDYSNLYVDVSDMIVKFNDYTRFEKQLYDLISPAKDLSNFEKYIYAYNVVKKFKKYKETDEDRLKVSKVYLILENEYMSCEGFSNLFGDLLEKLGIASKELSSSVDTSYDKVLVGEEDVGLVNEPVNKSEHARRYVYLKDDKYGIDGFYVSDPTWDNNLEHDYYTYLAITNDEESHSGRYIWVDLSSTYELFNVRSVSEFYEKVNFLLSHHNDEKNGNINLINYIDMLCKKYAKYIENNDSFNDNIDNINKLIINLIDQIDELDKAYVEYIKNKYSFINNLYKFPDDVVDVSELLFELANYVVSHVNKELSGEVIMQGVANVYSSVYGYTGDELDSKIQEIIEDNKRKQSRAFPMMTSVNNDGEESIYMNPRNKFDFEYGKKVL